MWGIHPLDDGKIRFFYRGAASVTLDSNKSILDGKWHHVVCVRNVEDGRREIWIDGVLDVYLTGDTATYDPNPYPITILNEHPTSAEDSPYNGCLLYIRVWNTYLIDSEIKELFDTVSSVVPIG